MTALPPPPRPDAEVERRLAALKAGVDPSAPPPTPGGPPAGPPSGGLPGSSQRDEARPRPKAGPALRGEVLDDAPPGGAPGPGEREGPGVRAVAWGISQAEAGRLGLWIGGGLVAFGAYLVLADIVPGVALVGSILMAVAGVALLGWHMAGRAGSWALHGGAVLAGFGIARLIADIGNLPSAGWGTLGAGLGLVAIAIRRRWRHEGLGWQAWVGGGLVVFGGWGVLGAVIPGFPTLGDLIVPAVLVLVGAAVLRRGMRGESPRR